MTPALRPHSTPSPNCNPEQSEGSAFSSSCTRRSSLATLFLALVFLFAALPASAQGPFTGTPPFGSFGGGPDVINLANLNSHITVPVLHKPGRGTNFTYDLTYDSSVWYPVGTSGSQAWTPVINWGWRAQTEVTLGYVSSSLTLTTCDVNNRKGAHYFFSNWAYHDGFGAPHQFNGETDIFNGSCGTGTSQLNATAVDGSGYQISIFGGTVTLLTSSNGRIINAPHGQPSGPGSVTDRNGNQISVSNTGVFTDTLGTPVLTAAGAGTAASPITLTYTAPSGASPKYQINYTNYTIATNFGVSGISEYKSSTAMPLVTSIALPDGSQYTFGYEPTPSVPAAGACTPIAGTTCVTARLISMTLPTGGMITYGYSGGNNGILPDGTVAILTRTTPDGVWTYAQVKNTGAASTTTITAPKLSYDPAPNQTVINFQGIYETERQVYQGSSTGGTLLRSWNTCYNASASPCTGIAITLPIIQRTVIDQYGTGGLQCKHNYVNNAAGGMTEQDDFDYGSGAPGPLLKKTLVTYATIGNITAFRQTMIVQDGTGVAKYRQDSSYDQYTSFTGANCITGAPNHDDSGHGCTFVARGNLTSLTTYTDPATPSGGITKNFTFDSLGNMRAAQVNCCQTKQANYSVATKYAYPDSIVSGSSNPTLTTSFTYDLNMGLTLTSTDPNSLMTTNTYDTMGRTLTSQVGANPASSFTYSDFNNSTTFTPWTVQSCSPVAGTNKVCKKTILDGLGRASTQQTLDGTGTAYSATDTKYDALGRPFMTSNPYITGSGSFWTTTQSDGLGRISKTTSPAPDNSQTAYSYSDSTVSMTDPAGKQRRMQSDSLGRVVSVWEPDPANGNSLTLQTTYTYTVLGALTSVAQGVQSRSYVLDALGRPTSSTTPEAGTVCFGSVTGTTCNSDGYDSFNNLLKKTDARGVVTTYGYDTLNRLTSVSYAVGTTGVPATATVSLSYSLDSSCNAAHGAGCIGQLITMTDGVGSEQYSYNALEQRTQVQKTIGATTYTTGYTYNFAGELTSTTYPSGRVVQQNVDIIGRGASVVGTLAGVNTTYASGFIYNPAFQATGFQYGNGMSASFGFSADRLQLNCIDYSTTNRSGTCAHDATTKFGSSFSFGSAGANDGLISSITDPVDSGRNTAYTYDSLYRLTTAATAGSAGYPAWGLTMAYDRYGNRTAQSVLSGCVAPMTCPQPSFSVATATNRLMGAPYSYDANGNMTNDGQNTLVYDAESHAVSATNSSSSGTYAYDGNGLRAEKCVPNCTSPTTSTVYIFSASNVIAEYDNGALPSSPSREHIYSGSQRIATVSGSTTNYLHRDQMSVRLITDSTGTTVAQRGHFPFGETWYETGATITKYKFSTYERDAESGNDYAQARFYVSRIGRFSSPDRVSGNPGNPQSWNRYSYVLNDPVNHSDSTGMYCQWDDGTVDADVEEGGATEDECNDGGGTWIDGPSPNTDPGSNSDTPDAKALSDCVNSLYGIDMTSFTPAQPGINGSFSGTGFDINVPGVISDQNGGQDPINVTINSSQYSLFPLGGNQGIQNACGSNAPGCIQQANIVGNQTGQYQVLVASDLVQSPLSDVSIIELGNALDVISGTQSWAQAQAQDDSANPNPGPVGISGFTPNNNPPGLALLNCVTNGGPPSPDMGFVF